MPIPTEPVGSIPRSTELIAGMQQFAAGRLSREQLARLQDDGVRDTIKRFEATESPVISDGEQSKPSFATYPIHGLASLAPDGVTIPFADGHTRRLPRLTAGPFRYQTYADVYLVAARAHTRMRSEEHTSELQSPYDLVCRLLLEINKMDESFH